MKKASMRGHNEAVRGRYLSATKKDKLNKLVESAEDAIADVFDGATILFGGFGSVGAPTTLNLALIEKKDVKGLTLVGCAITVMDHLEQLIVQHRVKKVISSYPFLLATVRDAPGVGQDSISEKYYLEGAFELERVPFGTLFERIRASGCGIPAFYCPVGVGTIIEEGKEKRILNGREYILETAITGDFAFIHAHKGDRLGNLSYRLAARNTNPIVATAAKITIAEVDEIVEPGEIDPDLVHTPGIYIDRVIKSTKYEILFR